MLFCLAILALQEGILPLLTRSPSVTNKAKSKIRRVAPPAWLNKEERDHFIDLCDNWILDAAQERSDSPYTAANLRKLAIANGEAGDIAWRDCLHEAADAIECGFPYSKGEYI
jgi:hypothetical protein